MSTIIKRPQAERDLEECFVFIGADNLDAALRFLAAAEETFSQLVQFPRIGKSKRVKTRILPGIRQFPIKGFESYLVFYRPIIGGIEIIRVLYGARDLEGILDEE
jgi:toxin ParE1/3/4